MVVTVDTLVVFTEDITVNDIGLCGQFGGGDTEDTGEETTCHHGTEVVVVDGRVESESLCLDTDFSKVLRAEVDDTDQVVGGSNSLDAVMGLEERHPAVFDLTF